LNPAHRIMLTLLVPAAALVAMGAAAADLEIEFHWSPCPPLGEYGVRMGPAERYTLFVSRNGGAEEVAGATMDTFFVLPVSMGQDVRVRVQGEDADGVKSLKSEWSDPVMLEFSGSVPQVAYLKDNYPNPFNPETTLRYLVPNDLPVGAPLSLEIFDLQGRRMRALPVERSGGMHEVKWNGRDTAERPAASGTYLVRYMVGTMVETGKMTLTK